MTSNLLPVYSRINLEFERGERVLALHGGRRIVS